jgi:hypothetical protein
MWQIEYKPKYSVDEMDRMRKCIVHLYEPRPAMDYNQGEPNKTAHQKRVEEMLRTFMIAGTRPEELEEKAKKTEPIYDDTWEGS